MQGELGRVRERHVIRLVGCCCGNLGGERRDSPLPASAERSDLAFYFAKTSVVVYLAQGIGFEGFEGTGL